MINIFIYPPPLLPNSTLQIQGLGLFISKIFVIKVVKLPKGFFFRLTNV